MKALRNILFWSAAGAAGLATSWFLAQAVLFLLPQARPGPPPLPVRPVALAVLPEEPAPDRAPLPRPSPRRSPAAREAPSRKSAPSTPAPPLPALPELEWAAPGPGALALPLPDYRPPGPSARGGAHRGRQGGSQPAAFRKKEPFHWVYAPELQDREAMERAWPRRALLRGQGGRVVLEVTVGADRRVHSARVVSARPPGVFEKAALRMVRRWRGSRPGTFLQPVRFVPPEPRTW